MGSVDPDVDRDFCGVVESKGYPCELHQVITEDGYVLGVFRINHAASSYDGRRATLGPILLQHGVLDSSFA